MLPSTSTWSGACGRPATARLIAHSDARRMFMRSMRARLATATDTSPLVEDRVVEPLALGRAAARLESSMPLG